MACGWLTFRVLTGSVEATLSLRLFAALKCSSNRFGTIRVGEQAAVLTDVDRYSVVLVWVGWWRRPATMGWLVKIPCPIFGRLGDGGYLSWLCRFESRNGCTWLDFIVAVVIAKAVAGSVPSAVPLSRRVEQSGRDRRRERPQGFSVVLTSRSAFGAGWALP